MQFLNEAAGNIKNHTHAIKGSFLPLVPIPSGFLQTMLGYYWPQLPDVAYCRQTKVTVSESDAVLLYHYNNDGIEPVLSNPLILMLHGLAGDYQSKYLNRLTKVFLGKGHPVVRFNLRGAGEGAEHASKMYHGGCFEDLHCVVQSLEDIYPDRPIFLLGFSLGANIALGWAGRYLNQNGSRFDLAGNSSGDGISSGVDLKSKVKKIIAVCPAVDLGKGAENLSRSRMMNSFFVKEMLSQVYLCHTREELLHLTGSDLSDTKTIVEFDERYTAKMNGFLNADDYYSQCSSFPDIENIPIEVQILADKLDPLVDYRLFLQLTNPKVNVYLTRGGGHLGYIDRSGKKRRYMDWLLEQWVADT